MPHLECHHFTLSEDNSTTPLQALQSCSESFTRVFSQAHCPNPGLLKRVRLRKSLPGHTPCPVPLAGKWDFSYLIFSTLSNNSALEMRPEHADCATAGCRLIISGIATLLGIVEIRESASGSSGFHSNPSSLSFSTFLAPIHLLQGQHKVNSVSF